MWFFGDEWNFLVGRGLSYAPTNPQSIWFPHNEHWSTLPVLLWRALYSGFHLSTYWPYILPVLFAQVAVMHLAWRISLRAGAAPWVATAAVAVLGFLGAGSEDLAWGFQIGFVGSVLFGLLAFDLMDQPGAAKRAGYLTLASLCLLASLMCSTIGDAMVVGAAVLALARLPWKRALAVLALPVVAYGAWFAGVGRLGLAAHSDRFTLGTLTSLPRFVWDGLSWALGRAFNLEAAGVVILIGIIAWVAWHAAKILREQPVLLALSAATVSFYLLAGLGRDISTGTPDVSRYVYVAIALLTPVIATLLSPQRAPAVVRLAAVALLVVTLIGNVGGPAPPDQRRDHDHGQCQAVGGAQGVQDGNPDPGQGCAVRQVADHGEAEPLHPAVEGDQHDQQHGVPGERGRGHGEGQRRSSRRAPRQGRSGSPRSSTSRATVARIANAARKPHFPGTSMPTSRNREPFAYPSCCR